MIDDEALKNIEKLHKLKADGIITEEDFAKSKEEILHGKSTDTAKGITNAGLSSHGEGRSFVEWVTLPLKHYAQFDGRAQRKEYWMFQLIYVALLFATVPFFILSEDLGVVVFFLGALALVVPHIAVTVRRLHDQDRSGWFALLYLLPYVGAIIILVLMVLPGTQGSNRFGDDPLTT